MHTPPLDLDFDHMSLYTVYVANWGSHMHPNHFGDGEAADPGKSGCTHVDESVTVTEELHLDSFRACPLLPADTFGGLNSVKATAEEGQRAH